MSSKLQLVIPLLIISNLVCSQQILFYNSAGEITLPEFATHHRIANIDIKNGYFIGQVAEVSAF